jgi:hypothetical protein
MAKTLSINDSEKFDRFMERLARVFAIPRKKLDMLMFIAQEPPRIQRHRNVHRRRKLSNVIAK